MIQRPWTACTTFQKLELVATLISIITIQTSSFITSPRQPNDVQRLLQTLSMMQVALKILHMLSKMLLVSNGNDCYLITTCFQQYASAAASSPPHTVHRGHP